MRTNCGATLPTGSSAHPDPGSRAGYDTPSSPGGSSTGSCQVAEPLIAAGTPPATIGGGGSGLGRRRYPCPELAGPPHADDVEQITGLEVREAPLDPARRGTRNRH